MIAVDSEHSENDVTKGDWQCVATYIDYKYNEH